MNGRPRSFPHAPRTFAGFPASAQGSSRVLLECLGFLPGIGTATPSDVVTGLAKRLSALVLVLAMEATTSGTAFAQNRHPVCEAKQHDCGQPANIPSCCCGDLGTLRDAGTPAQSRTDVASGLSMTPVPPPFESPVLAAHAEIVTQASSPPWLALLDLTTLSLRGERGSENGHYVETRPGPAAETPLIPAVAGPS